MPRGTARRWVSIAGASALAHIAVLAVLALLMLVLPLAFMSHATAAIGVMKCSAANGSTAWCMRRAIAPSGTGEVAVTGVFSSGNSPTSSSSTL